MTGGVGSAGTWVQTKLHLPRLRRNIVARPRLSGLLDRGAEARLTLISAPAGFGKTTLLAGWLAKAAAENRSVAWLSLDANDRQPAIYWTYLIAALQSAVPGVGAGVLPLLQTGQPPIEAVLTAVVNELSALTHQVDLVLDDYHLVDGPDLRPGMEFLLDHLPPQIHLVISTRADPLLPLARLRARGELVEIRSADLRFTLDEVAAYLNDGTGPSLSASEIAALEGRTEGWIAALQLAALSMRGRKDIAGFISGFAGDDRYIVDYLVEEVLHRQTDLVRTFLLRTSLLDRLSGPLCDAVIGGFGGKATLEALDRANLFLVPLDDNRHWYRYHHLFADMLRAHLADERPDEVAELHRRASRWYENNGQPSPAVRHALAAGDVERAADLIEAAIPELQKFRQEAIIRGWLDVLPDEIIRDRPVLAIGLIGSLMSTNEFVGVEERLRDVERKLSSAEVDPADPESVSAGVVRGDAAELARLPAAIEMNRAGLALIRGDLSATLGHAQHAIDLAPVDDDVVRAGAAGLSGLAYWSRGDLEDAHGAYTACIRGLQRAGRISDVLGCSIALADIRMTHGRLSEAGATFDQALALAARDPAPVLRGTADMYVGLGRIACMRGDLAAATGYLLRSRELGEHLGLLQNPYRWRVAMAGVRRAQGDLAGALTLLDEAQRVYLGDFSPNVRPVPALRARLLAAQGNVTGALAWVRERGLSVDDTLSYVREFEHLTLATVLLAQYANSGETGSPAQIVRLLERLLAAAEMGGRTGSVIEILVVQALAHHAGGDTGRALTALERALELAEPEGYVRVFVDEGPAMASMLTAVGRRRAGLEYVQRLLNAGRVGGAAVSSMTPAAHASRLDNELVEMLSARELEVVRLLATDLDGPAIARRLFVSVNTLRTHTKSIYAKLGVNSRRAAVRRAEERGLLTSTRGR